MTRFINLISYINVIPIKLLIKTSMLSFYKSKLNTNASIYVIKLLLTKVKHTRNCQQLRCAKHILDHFSIYWETSENE